MFFIARAFLIELNAIWRLPRAGTLERLKIFSNIAKNTSGTAGAGMFLGKALAMARFEKLYFFIGTRHVTTVPSGSPGLISNDAPIRFAR